MYANVNSKDTFVYWLEYKRMLFGIGANSFKFGIYMAKEDGQYYLAKGGKKLLLTGNELNRRFSLLKKGIIQALELTEKNRINEIIEIDIPIWNMVLQKILLIYYPDKFINVGSADILLKCAKEIGLSGIDLSASNLILINHECRKRLNSEKELEDWNYAQLGNLVWKTYKTETPPSSKTEVQYWLYAPGESAVMWNEFFDSGIMALGWDDLGDLSTYKNKEEIAKKLQQDKNAKGSQRINAKANFDFRNNMKIGDVVIAKKGRSEYVGYGIVTSDYFFDDKRSEYRSCRKVNWLKKGNWTEKYGSIAVKTLTNITDLSTNIPGFSSYVDRLKHLIGINDTTNVDMKHPKNIILYGPPGTGKTYHSLDKAVEIATGNTVGDHAESKQIFDELRTEGQIEFITFHQNYSYEDFVVGISPDVTSGQLRFDKRDGVFKKITERAKKNWLASNNKTFSDFGFDYVLNSFFSKLIEEDKPVIIPMKKAGYSFKVISIDNGRIRIIKQTKENESELSLNVLKEIYEGSYNRNQSGFGVYYYPLINKLQEHAATLKPEKLAHEELKNFVLVIDEINRANISKVFGELITLIEEDKRLGQPNELKVTLPNGEKEFGVPPNLYIIGTMNTADKSIALIDIALRRRFEFIGKYPDCGVLGVAESNLLTKINAAIYEKKKSADYLIGHAYFMRNQPIEDVLKNSVIPLLMEYFAGKTEIVSNIFEGTGWNVAYDSSRYIWRINEV